MLIQNISKRNFVLNIDGEIQTIVPNTLVEVSEELANDLINKTLIQMKTKIENYKITKTISKIEKLN